MNMRAWRTSLAGAALMTLIVAWVFSAFAPARPLWIWATLGWLAYAGNALLCLSLERKHSAGPLPAKWSLATVLLCVWVGMLWGSLAWWLPSEAPALQLLAALGSGMVLLGAANGSVSIGTLGAVVVPGLVLVPSAMIWHAHIPLAGAVSFALVLLILRHGLSVQRNMLGAIQQRHRVEALSEQLRIQQAKLQEAEREQAILNERQRLLRDMHDGVGASLIAALKMIEQGRLSLDDAAQVLQECLDDLRLVIDSLEPIDHDLVTLLATLRYRLGERLERAGVAIDWVMADIPPLPWLHAPQALEVLRILQEALANVLKHSRATRVRVSLTLEETSERGAVVALRVEDDGIGFAPDAAASGRGLRHMRHRSAQIGGSLDIEATQGGGTRVCVRLPLDGPVRGRDCEFTSFGSSRSHAMSSRSSVAIPERPLSPNSVF